MKKLLVLLTVFALLCINTLAFGDTAAAVAPQTANAGKTFDVVLVFYGNVTEAVQFELEYDKTLLSLENVSALPEKWIAEYAESFLVYDTDLEHALDGETELIKLTFTVLENVSKKTSVTVRFNDIEDNNGQLSEAGSTVVLLPKMRIGDIDGNGNVTARDRMILSRYLDSWDGYDIYFD